MRTLALCVLAFVTATSLVACSDREKGPTDEQVRGEFEAEVCRIVEYTVRGEVVSLPTADEAMMVRHEAIPEFKEPGGMGMDVMVMPFPFADGLDIEGIAPGDKLALTFSVDYEEGWSPLDYRVIRFEALPQEAQLDFTPLPRDGASE